MSAVARLHKRGLRESVGYHAAATFVTQTARRVVGYLQREPWPYSGNRRWRKQKAMVYRVYCCPLGLAAVRYSL